MKKISQDTKNLVLPADLDWQRGDGSCPNEWIYGEHGCGKSFKARKENPGFYTKMMNNLWESYAGQDVAILEDMDPFHKSLSYDLKIWGDRYSFRGRVLFGSIVLRPKKIVITSQYHPNEIWNDPETVGAICDRFKVIHLTEKYTGTENAMPARKPAFNRAIPNKVLSPEEQAWFNLTLTDKEALENACTDCFLNPCECMNTEHAIVLESDESEDLMDL